MFLYHVSQSKEQGLWQEQSALFSTGSRKAAEKEKGGWAAGEKAAHTRKQKHTLRVGLEVGKVQPSLGHLPDDILSPTLLKIQLSAPCTTLLNLSEEDRHTINNSSAGRVTNTETFA